MEEKVSAFMTGLTIGAIFGVIVSLIVINAPSVSSCAREHNVYQCELIAVPVEPGSEEPAQ